MLWLFKKFVAAEDKLPLLVSSAAVTLPLESVATFPVNAFKSSLNGLTAELGVVPFVLYQSLTRKMN